MKALQKASKFLSDYTSVVVIAIAVVTFFLPSMMGWVNLALFTDMVANKFTCQSIIIGIIMFSMGLTPTADPPFGYKNFLYYAFLRQNTICRYKIIINHYI